MTDLNGHMMSSKLNEPAYYPPPPPLLPRGMRPANPTMYTQRPLYYPQQGIPPGMVPPAHMMSAMNRPPPPQPTEPTQSSPNNIPSEAHILPGQLSNEEMEKRIDKSSIKGNFGWMTLDGVNIPCLFRNEEKYVSVRMVEQKLLSKYPSTYPDELRERAPLMSQFITPAEARLLNEINIEHCECEFGQQAFTEKDLIVAWPDFVEFYKIVKKHFPNENVASKQRKSQAIVSGGGGWVQINNTVVPYLKRLTPNAKETLRLAPLPVIKYAAGLLTNTEVPCLEPTEDECKQLSDMCKKAGLDFNFSSSNTQLVLLSMIQMYSETSVSLKKLPDNDPFSSAEYCPDFEAEDSKANAGPQPGVLLPTVQQVASPPMHGNRPASTGHHYNLMSAMDKRPPPNVTVQRSSTMVNNNPNISFTLSEMDRHRPSMSNQAQHGSSSPALHALEQMSGPPVKRQKTATSSSCAVPRASPNNVNVNSMTGNPMNSNHMNSNPMNNNSMNNPMNNNPMNNNPMNNNPMNNNSNMNPNPMNSNHMNGNPMSNNAPGMIQGYPPGSMPSYSPMMFGGPNTRMMPPPPGMIPGGMTGWPPMPHNPGDMQKLAQIMNMQAAILSQTGPMGMTRPPMVGNPAQQALNQVAPAKPHEKQPTSMNQTKGPQSKPNPTDGSSKKNKSILETIQPIDFHGKKISCLVKEDTKQHFALIEAISRVYFPLCSLEEFINAIINVLQISIYQLNRDEEKAFIKFYGLPTESLKCNKVLNLHDLDQCMPQMKYIFSEKQSPPSEIPKSDTDCTKARRQSGEMGQQQTSAAQDTNNNGEPRPGVVSSNLPPQNPFKKNNYKPKPSALAKPSSKLEDAVNRLRQNKMMQLGPNDPEADADNQAPIVPRNPFVSATVPVPPAVADTN